MKRGVCFFGNVYDRTLFIYFLSGVALFDCHYDQIGFYGFALCVNTFCIIRHAWYNCEIRLFLYVSYHFFQCSRQRTRWAA